MKAAQLTKFEGSKAVEILDIEEPKISEGKILVEVYASGVNPFDWKITKGIMPLSLPLTMGGDFSGIVLETGSGVKEFKQNDKVYGQGASYGGGSGTFAEICLCSANTVALKPGNLGFKESGALPLVGVSCIQALNEHINLKSGQKILIHGGAGGIGSIAIQIAKNIGAYVATTVSPNDMNYVTDLGADKVIDYKSQRFEDLLTDYDAVFDTVGKDTYKRSFEVLKSNGIVISMLESPDHDLMKKYKVTAISQQTRVTKERLNKLTKLVEEEAIKVHIEKTFPLNQAAQALSYLENSPPKGKIVIEVKNE